MKTVSLGELEKHIMDILWEKKHATTRDVLTHLKKERKLAYTTVATILQRLFDKKLVGRKEHGAGYIYFPKVSKEIYTKNVAQSFLKNFIDSFGDIAIASFASSVDTLPDKKRKQFLTVLETYDKNK